MSAEYSRDHCKIAVAKVLQTIGWHAINSTPLETLTDILSSYIKQIAKLTNDYANEFGQTEPNLDHLGLAFQELGVNLSELEEYVTYVNFIPQAQAVPKFPIAKESNLNFLKPGSKEVLTRPIHIHEHLPPMYPLLEEQSETPSSEILKDNGDVEEFKKPADVSSPEFRRLKREEEGGRPTREISSVMMTTSGFLSPAREGRLPEAKAPIPPPEPPRPPSPGPPVPDLVPVKKKPEKKKEKVPKEFMKSDDKPTKKINPMKHDIWQIKKPKNAVPPRMPPNIPIQASHFMPPMNPAIPGLMQKAHAPSKASSYKQALAAAKAKTEKLNTTITPIPPVKTEQKFQIPMHQPVVDKLISEPDRKKINIIKKISPKPKQNMQAQLMQQAQDIVNKINLSSDITIEPIHPQMHKTESFFDNAIRPATPPTPRTPELLAQSPPFLAKEKRKRKEKPDKPRAKRPRKQPQLPQHFMDPTDILDMGRPKTPDAQHMLFRKPAVFPPMPGPPNPPLTFPFPIPNFGGPGLIPSLPFQFGSSMHDFAHFAAAPLKPEPMPKVSPKPRETVKPEPVEIVPLPITPSLRRSPSPPPVEEPQQPLIKPESDVMTTSSPDLAMKKSKEHKKEKKDKTKKKNKKEKVKDKSEKKKLKEAKKEKGKIKKDKKKKGLKEEADAIEGLPPENPAIPKILLKVNSPSPRPETPDSSKKLNIKPIVKKEEASPERRQRESSPGLAQISALVIGPPKPKTPVPPPPVEKPAAEISPSTSAVAPRPPGRPRIHPLKPKLPPKPKKVEQPFVKRDADGNEVWICPACGQQDDGRPMIGCDGCDAWYHWVCVGIQVPPDENENWYCKPCLAKKNEDLQDKKKKRKKKDKTH